MHQWPQSVFLRGEGCADELHAALSRRYRRASLACHEVNTGNAGIESPVMQCRNMSDTGATDSQSQNALTIFDSMQ